MTTMAIVEADWHKYLSPGSEIPPDVFFLVKTEVAEDVESSQKSFGAHKVLLAGNSPVFRRMFFGPMMETGEGIEVKETTPEAFSTMIDYIYKPPGEEFSLQDIRCPQKLFELLAIADRYEILNTDHGCPWEPANKMRERRLRRNCCQKLEAAVC